MFGLLSVNVELFTAQNETYKRIQCEGFRVENSYTCFRSECKA